MDFYFYFAEMLFFSIAITYAAWTIYSNQYRAFFEFIAACLFGILLEASAIFIIDSYNYSPSFLLQVGNPPQNLPILIGIGWALVVVAAMQTGDKLGYDEKYIPFIDGLLALSIDLSMDTIAIRIDEGFWTWKDLPLESTASLNSFFGVSYGNFIVWLFIVSSFSYVIRYSRKNWLNHNTGYRYLLFVVISPLVGTLMALVPLILIRRSYLVLAKIFSWNTDNILLSIQWYLLIWFIIIISLYLYVAIKYWNPDGLTKSTNILPFIVFFSFHGMFLIYFLLNNLWDVYFLFFMGIALFSLSIFIEIKIIDFQKLKNKFLRS